MGTASHLSFCARIHPGVLGKALFSLACKLKVLVPTEASCPVLGTSAQLETHLAYWVAVVTYSPNGGFAAIAAILCLKVVQL